MVTKKHSSDFIIKIVKEHLDGNENIERLEKNTVLLKVCCENG